MVSTEQNNFTTDYPEASNQQWLPAQDIALLWNGNWNDSDFPPPVHSISIHIRCPRMMTLRMSQASFRRGFHFTQVRSISLCHTLPHLLGQLQPTQLIPQLLTTVPHSRMQRTTVWKTLSTALWRALCSLISMQQAHYLTKQQAEMERLEP
jgi:hypothetical protein